MMLCGASARQWRGSTAGGGKRDSFEAEGLDFKWRYGNDEGLPRDARG
jgi:hypothetical protein